MIGHVWSVLCKDIITDAESNNVSLINVYERITLPKSQIDRIPLDKDGGKFPFHCQLMSLWIRETDDAASGIYRIRFLSPDGKPLIETDETRIEIEPPSRRTRTTLLNEQMLFVRPGIYHFQVQLKVKKNWETVAKVPFEMVVS